MSRSRATLADVARLAGLSKTAASMVLNGREGTRLSAEAHQRVFAAAAELGYRPNVAARSLRTQKTSTFAFISDIVATTRFAGDMIRGALDAAREHDHVLLIAETQGDESFEQHAIEAMLDRQVDGVIYAAMATRQLAVPAALLTQPTVLLNAASDGPALRPARRRAGRARRSPPRCSKRATSDRIGLIGRNRLKESDPEVSLAARGQACGGSSDALDDGRHPTSARASPARTGCPSTATRRCDRYCASGPTDRGDLHERPARLRRLSGARRGRTRHPAGRLGGLLRRRCDRRLAPPGLSTAALPHEQMGRRAVELLLAGPATDRSWSRCRCADAAPSGAPATSDR